MLILRVRMKDMENTIINLALSDFEKEGLYLLFPDSTKLELTKENIEKVTAIIKRFGEELKVSSANQVKRLNLVCKNDAFMNAFVNTQLVTQFLINMEDILTHSFNGFEKSVQVQL